MSVFSYVKGRMPSRSFFDLTHSKLFTCDMGMLIPIMIEHCMPGDVFKLSHDIVIRFQPLVSPILHEIDVYVHTFFVPHRIVEPDDWEDFITGGEDGDDATVLTTQTWQESSSNHNRIGDYFGWPVDVTPTYGPQPLMLPKMAYNLIWNEYYRDETHQSKVSLENNIILFRNWAKDYFTSALPWQQRGTAVALPLAGTSSAVYDTGLFINNAGPVDTNIGVSGSFSNGYMYAEGVTSRNNIDNLFNNNTVDFSSATTFDVSDLRTIFQVQKWMEANARGGVRLTEFLKMHYGVSPRDDRLDRPEYVGGMKAPVIVSEVLQTSESNTTPQGTLTGHGMTVGSGYIGNYRVAEHGTLISLMSVMPKAYYQDGWDRQWLQETRYDFPFPEFANLSEQAIYNSEVNATGYSGDADIFGYIGRYDEFRQKRNIICGQMRDDFDHWHLSRQFPAATINLNQYFITTDPDDAVDDGIRKDCFAVPSEPGLIVHVGNNLKAYRPIPIQNNPGLLDH